MVCHFVFQTSYTDKGPKVSVVTVYDRHEQRDFVATQAQYTCLLLTSAGWFWGHTVPAEAGVF